MLPLNPMRGDLAFELSELPHHSWEVITDPRSFDRPAGWEVAARRGSR